MGSSTLNHLHLMQNTEVLVKFIGKHHVESNLIDEICSSLFKFFPSLRRVASSSSRAELPVLKIKAEQIIYNNDD